MRINEILIGSDRVSVTYKEIEGSHGTYDYVPRPTIVINSEGPAWLQASTLLHESIHAIDRKYNTLLEEHQVQALEIGLRDLIRQNPKLIDALRASP
jgi:hypothetical protein